MPTIVGYNRSILQRYTMQTVNPLALPWTPLKWKNALPGCCGIYFVLSEGKVIYIGRSKSISRRWLNHHRYEMIAAYPDVRIAWMEVSDEFLLREIENALIQYFDPPLNQKMPIGDGVKRHLREHRVEVRLNDLEMEKLRAYSESKGQPITECIRDWIKQLPETKE